MKKILKKFYDEYIQGYSSFFTFRSFVKTSAIVAAAFYIAPQYVYAAGGTGTESLDSLINFACEWLTKIGMCIALFGGADFAIGWKSDNPDERIRGMKTCAAGFMLAAVGKAPDLFGLSGGSI